MGPSFVMLCWTVLLIPIGLLLGALVTFVGVPLVRRFRRPSHTKRIGCLSKLGLMLLVCTVFVAVTVCLGAFLMEKDLGDYWKSQGAWDWWRMPLEYPYHLIAVGNLDEGTIENWDTRSQPVHDITRFFKSGNMIVGQADSRWFSFDCGSGQVTWYTTAEDYQRAIRELGFKEDPVLLTVEENMNLYWRNH